MDTYRVFISYSHDDKEQVEKIVNVLKSNGLTPMWDKNFLYGHGFHEQIKNYITHAHVFVPFITKNSSDRGWVHQEIGYAMALNVPVLPVTKDQVPGEMLQQLLAVQLSEDSEILKNQLSKKVFAQLVERAQKTCKPLFECAEHHEDRTQMMVDYANTVLEIGYPGEVLQKGALSSFHIPDKPINHQTWKERYGKYPVSDFRCRLLWEERKVLEKHAKEAGCKLIIDPFLSYKKYGPNAKKARLNGILDFLKKMPDSKVTIAIEKNISEGQNLTIVGDWFMAESISATLGVGYRQTIFTRHAPSVRSRIELFNQELESLLDKQNLKASSTRKDAISTINKILAGLEKNKRMSVK